MNTSKRRLLNRITLVAGVALVGFVGWRIWLGQTNGTLALTVVPKDASVSIDGGRARGGGTMYLRPGIHTLRVERSGFSGKTDTVTITKKQTTRHAVLLDAANDIGNAYLQSNPNDVLLGEGIMGQEIRERGRKLVVDYPILNRLPYETATFSLSPGASRRTPGKEGTFGVYVRCKTTEGDSKALAWMRSQGYDPGTLEMIYDSGCSSRTELY